MRSFPLVVLMGSLLATSAANAADAQDWLLKLQSAEQQKSFHGTFVYERDGSFSTHGIWHEVDAGGAVKERLLQLDGPPYEVLRTNGKTDCATGTLVEQSSEAGQSWLTRTLDPQQLSQWYDLRDAGESRVAGRNAVVLALVPRDQHRYGFELHLDRETALPLKSLLINEDGHVLERFQFTDFVPQEAGDGAASKASGDCKPVQVSQSEVLPDNAWRSDWVPPGFTLNSILQRRSPASSEPVACMLYGDGITQFSVFLEPLRGARFDDARSQLGPTVAVSRHMPTAEGEVMVTVVGEIPLGTAERIALSIRPGEAQSLQ
ncbi:MucB/RseB C-terminal domain-containing protein [Pseudomonas kuykendallii]|uniref:Sigma E regulatory protein, MucB/RseB n=1 Tax=Pseudomonas kuykendallii TaxID=1007099 RepID=A0A1H3BYK2_9PSED|nr:MucB/RseB C-terminal domain-containing protein [Pseudomonas kuykendallii]MCQ4269742.1 MucB/RseB C-terminal domain-containing protein [Pseudomonas kuykendallii]SDX47022.1 sigma E regulatory protein, MucB/RseB [Pseudomonas kuykendallii]